MTAWTNLPGPTSEQLRQRADDQRKQAKETAIVTCDRCGHTAGEQFMARSPFVGVWFCKNYLECDRRLWGVTS